MRVPVRSSAIAAVLCAFIATLVVTVFGASPAAAQELPEPSLDWSRCLLGTQPIECARLEVPLDYDDPGGPRFDVAVRRISADPADGPRRGSLVLNPGGPGAGAAPLLLWAYEQRLFPGWDLIAPDPRGVGDSQRLVCGNPLLVALEPRTGNPFIDLRNDAGSVAESCAAEPFDLFPHVGTVNVARDFDRLREALGETRLDYYGASYGTHIGAVYAELFPDRVGRFVLDGPVLLDDRSRLRLAQIRGFETALERFDQACDVTASCRLAPFGAESVWRNLRWQLSRETIPGVVRAPSGRLVTLQADVATLDTATNAALYSGRGSWQLFSDALFEASQGDASLLLEMQPGGFGSSDVSVDAAHLAVTCNDDARRATAADAQRATVQAIAAGYDVFAPAIGPLIGACESVPVSPTAPPVLDIGIGDTATMLVIAGAHDPATPLAGAQHFVNRIRSTRMLTVIDEGHVMVGRNNRCVDGAVLDYLNTGALPDEGAVCSPTDGKIGILFEAGSNGGLSVVSVQDGSAAQGLLLPDDELMAFNGAPFAGIEYAESYDISVLRNGEPIVVTVIAGPPDFWRP